MKIMRKIYAAVFVVIAMWSVVFMSNPVAAQVHLGVGLPLGIELDVDAVLPLDVGADVDV